MSWFFKSYRLYANRGDLLRPHVPQPKDHAYDDEPHADSIPANKSCTLPRVNLVRRTAFYKFTTEQQIHDENAKLDVWRSAPVALDEAKRLIAEGLRAARARPGVEQRRDVVLVGELHGSTVGMMAHLAAFEVFGPESAPTLMLEQSQIGAENCVKHARQLAIAQTKPDSERRHYTRTLKSTLGNDVFHNVSKAHLAAALQGSVVSHDRRRGAPNLQEREAAMLKAVRDEAANGSGPLIISCGSTHLSMIHQELADSCNVVGLMQLIDESPMSPLSVRRASYGLSTEGITVFRGDAALERTPFDPAYAAHVRGLPMGRPV